jgi:hypothetical protein
MSADARAREILDFTIDDKPDCDGNWVGRIRREKDLEKSI